MTNNLSFSLLATSLSPPLLLVLPFSPFVHTPNLWATIKAPGSPPAPPRRRRVSPRDRLRTPTNSLVLFFPIFCRGLLHRTSLTVFRSGCVFVFFPHVVFRFWCTKVVLVSTCAFSEVINRLLPFPLYLHGQVFPPGPPFCFGKYRPSPRRYHMIKSPTPPHDPSIFSPSSVFGPVAIHLLRLLA